MTLTGGAANSAYFLCSDSDDMSLTKEIKYKSCWNYKKRFNKHQIYG